MHVYEGLLYDFAKAMHRMELVIPRPEQAVNEGLSRQAKNQQRKKAAKRKKQGQKKGNKPAVGGEGSKQEDGGDGNGNGGSSSEEVDWNALWEEWIQRTKQELEDKVEHFYTDVYEKLMSLAPGGASEQQIELGMEIIIGAVSEAEDSQGRQLTWSERAERAALKFTPENQEYMTELAQAVFNETNFNWLQDPEESHNLNVRTLDGTPVIPSRTSKRLETLAANAHSHP
ncbi:hypothetical protein HDV00_001018 [Rhizophlyctis rosea]|nr:hypothetical protein HDV00_001018 [Rhizophlyctis rosea]